MDISMVISVIAAAVSVVSAFTSYRLGLKQMYVDIVVKARLQSLNERRHALKDLYYYTNPNIVEQVKEDAKNKHIQKLLKLQSTLEYRILDCLYPDSEVLDKLTDLVKAAIVYLESGNKPDKYDEIRSKGLKLLRIYNFASWEYGQAHSTGKKGNSVCGFDAAFVKTLKSFEKNQRNKSKIEDILHKYV